MPFDYTRKDLIDYLTNNFEPFVHACFSTLHPATPYLSNWHIRLLCEHLKACEAGDISRLIINLPPRMLKSMVVSVAWPAWLLGHNPAQKIIVASYTESLAIKHSLDCRAIVQSDWYRSLFPETKILRGQQEKIKFVTSAHGLRRAVSVGSMITGEGGNIIIVDDPHNPTHIHSPTKRKLVQDWFTGTLSTRLDDKKKGVFIVMMQRLHPDDLTGFLLSKPRSRWKNLVIPAIAENTTEYSISDYSFLRTAGSVIHDARESLEQIEQARQELGSFAFAAQYQQQPITLSGTVIQPVWCKRYDEAPTQPLRIIQSWDTAIKSGEKHDYSVCTTWAEAVHPTLEARCYYLLDVLRGKWSFTQLKQHVLSAAEAHHPQAILIEDKASGQQLLQILRSETTLPLIAVSPVQNKESRAVLMSALWESGKVLLPRHAHWLPAYEEELFSFPHVLHDDQMDSTTQALLWLQKRQPLNPGIRRL